jgi:drug/metabolite transporter (DMT)-like permease
MRYSAILWSVILGYLVWGDLPDSWTITGTTIVIASGLYILHREYRAQR